MNWSDFGGKGWSRCDHFLPWEHDISGKPPGNPQKFGTDAHLVPWINWWSKVKSYSDLINTHLESCECNFTGTPGGKVFFFSNFAQLLTYFWPLKDDFSSLPWGNFSIFCQFDTLITFQRSKEEVMVTSLMWGKQYVDWNWIGQRRQTLLGIKVKIGICKENLIFFNIK